MRIDSKWFFFSSKIMMIVTIMFDNLLSAISLEKTLTQEEINEAEQKLFSMLLQKASFMPEKAKNNHQELQSVKSGNQMKSELQIKDDDENGKQLQMKGNQNFSQKNYFKALVYYFSSAEKNNSDALFKIGIFFQEGHGVTQNISKTIDYFFIKNKLIFFLFNK